MGRYIDLAGSIWGDAEYSDTTGFGKGVNYTLNWLDENPADLPGLTITESERRERIGMEDQNFIRGFGAGLHMAGCTVVPDPPKSNAEKLESKLRVFALETCTSEASLELVRSAASELAAWLDAAGVKAPEAGGDDE